MSECVNNYYVFNDKIKKSEDFDEKYLKEGKSLYEVIRIIQGVPLYVEKHLERLQYSSKLTGENVWLDSKKIEEYIIELVNANKVEAGNVKIVFNFNKENNFMMYFIKHKYPTQDMYHKGVSTILYHGERNNPNAKVIDSDFRKKVNIEIDSKKAYEAILVDRDGNITEGSKSNIFMVKDNEVLTAPLKDVLPGVTRAVIMELCSKLGLDVKESKVHYNDIKKFDALFICGTSPKVLPISRVDEFKFESANNVVLNRIKCKYDEHINKYVKSKRN
ncbi:aminotransferase class IV [Haloimpatiens sp. FM7330]|uniref:aminotransferase class IV n=1 Tax=Haloimpatiens sp. FM7330 TaxID=3298610 RepID=UPI00362D3D1E